MEQSTLDQVEALVEELSADEQLALMEHIARHLRGLSATPGSRHDLRGLWAGRFPDDLDIDVLLAELRQAWLSPDDASP